MPCYRLLQIFINRYVDNFMVDTLSAQNSGRVPLSFEKGQVK